MRSEGWDTGQCEQGMVKTCREFLPDPGFGKLCFEKTRLAHITDGVLKSVRFTDLRTRLLLDVIAQMTFEFVDDFGRINSAGGHLAAPLGDCQLEIKHSSFFDTQKDFVIFQCFRSSALIMRANPRQAKTAIGTTAQNPIAGI